MNNLKKAVIPYTEIVSRSWMFVRDVDIKKRN